MALALLLLRKGWNHEWGWALDQAAGTSSLLSPVTAGLIAHDRARAAEPSLASLAQTTPRGRPGLIGVLLGSLVWSMIALVLVAAVALVAAWRGGAVWPPTNWIALAEAIALLFAGAGVGFAIGAWTRNRAAGPLAFATMFVLQMFGGSLGVPEAFRAGGSVGTLLGLERTVSVSSSLIALHLCVGLLMLACGDAAGARGITPLWRHVGVWTSAALLLLSGAVAHRQSQLHDPLRATPADTCVPGPVTVCGPRAARPLLAQAGKDLAAAQARLGKDLDWVTDYELNRSNRPERAGGVLTLNPELMRDGHLSVDDIAATLTTPRPCAGYFAAAPPVDLMAAQSRVMEWVQQGLAGSTPTHATSDIKSAYASLTGCPVVKSDS
ncbi:MAG: hypothetical protein LWW86_09320 [Micrococcales bacterium]|nr:hypothetical protein [Micrococcales bacterium]